MPIDKQLIRSILINRKEIIQQLTFVPRSIAIEDATPTILVGVRRSGKSYLLYQKMFELASNGHSWDEFLYINFEDERLIGFDIQDFQTLLEAHYANSKQDPILFLDEIQIVHGWERFARRMADEKRQIYITGSNAQMLSREMEASLGGRYIAIQIFPFSFVEFLHSKSFSWNKNTFLSIKGRADIVSLFKEYFYFGGFPELVRINNKRDYLSSIYNKIYLGDIVLRYKVSNAYALEIMMKKIAETIRQPISYSRLTNVIAAVGVSVGKSTIIQYLEYAKESQILFHVQNYGSKLVEKTSNPKYYFVDQGILNLFVLDADTALLENIVAIHLIKNNNRDQVYYYQNNIEVDFYLPDVQTAIQVCYSLTDLKTREREVNALIAMAKHINIDNMLIITYDEEETIQVDNLTINVLPVWKWLLTQ